MLSTVNIITWNARGIKNKSTEFFEFLLRNNVHICLITETWLKPHINISHKEFFVYRKDRISRNGGGVAIVVRRTISHSLLPITNTSLIENVGIKIFINTGEIIYIHVTLQEV